MPSCHITREGRGSQQGNKSFILISIMLECSWHQIRETTDVNCAEFVVKSGLLFSKRVLLAEI